jgi:hypothetical protein
MRFQYFYHNDFVHALNPSTHQLFKRVNGGWIELRHSSELQCFRLKAVELTPSEVSRYAARLMSARVDGLPTE